VIPLNRIRVETALSRFPIHRLGKKDSVTIDLQRVSETGEADFKWEVTSNQKHGQPGPLAYKVDTLIVNRRIDEAGRPLPGVVKLGSLTELCTALQITDSGENRSNLKKALHQNASAYITAKIRYRTKTGKQRWGELGYTRYSVVFTGEMLPDGTMADAVYIIPNASFRDLLNQVEVRPLDYDYLTSLTPGAQRFYELLSFQVYGALAGGRPRARMRYSDYCNHAPQSRYFDFDRVKKQMFKIHAPHREAGYIAKIDYEATIDGEGAPDWDMFYTPGLKAIAEYEAFTRRQIRQTVENLPLPPIGEGEAPSKNALATTDTPLVDQMTRRGITPRKTAELLANLKPGQHVLDQIEYVDAMVAKDLPGRIENAPGLYVMYIRDDVKPPADFVSSRKRALIEQARDRKRGEAALLAQRKLEYESYCVRETLRFIEEVMPPDEREAVLGKHRIQNRQLFRDKSPIELDELSHGTLRSEIQDSGRVQLPTFEQYLQEQPAPTPA
jgi:hypothetical protein